MFSGPALTLEKAGESGVPRRLGAGRLSSFRLFEYIPAFETPYLESQLAQCAAGQGLDDSRASTGVPLLKGIRLRPPNVPLGRDWTGVTGVYLC